MTTNSDVISTLNGLIETCRDGQKGFQQAADGVNSGELKQLFLEISRQRASFLGELQDEVRRLGGDPEQTGSVAAALHRGWMDIKSAVTGEDEGAIIRECERGDEAAVESYREALGADLPANVRTIVERQFAHLKSGLERLRALERASGATS
ncbi:MAG TPA: PA2169 family four-helix-bundle protein [Pyrinomonadaceae bacterium]|nr:PA2169 family four-helix-bundle protein [Pyrinomonadaceae bacterium]